MILDNLNISTGYNEKTGLNNLVLSKSKTTVQCTMGTNESMILYGIKCWKTKCIKAPILCPHKDRIH